MLYNIKLFIFLGILVVSNTSYAQRSMNLQQCIDMAWERNLDLKSKTYLKRSADIDLKQAKQAKLPNLNGSTRLGVNLGKTIDPTSNEFINTSFLSNNFGLSSNVSIYNYNRINNLIKQARLSQSSSSLDFEQIKMDVALQVTTAYVNSLFALENLKNTQLQLENSQAQLDQIDVLINTGSRPKNDRLELVAALAIQEQNIIIVENQYDLSLLNLKQLLRLDYKEDLTIELIDDYTLNTDAETLTMDRLVNTVKDSYPALQSAAINTNISAIQVKIARSAMYPSISAGVSLGSNYSNQGKEILSSNIILQEQPVLINGETALFGVYSRDIQFQDKNYFNQLNDNISYGFGINMNIPIYNNYSSKASIEKAKLGFLQSQNNYDKIENLLVVSLQQVLADAKASKKEVSATEKSLVAMQGAYDNAQKKNSAGTISTFEFLQVKNQLESAQLKNTIAKYNHIFKVKLLDYYMGL